MNEVNMQSSEGKDMRFEVVSLGANKTRDWLSVVVYA